MLTLLFTNHLYTLHRTSIICFCSFKKSKLISGLFFITNYSVTKEVSDPTLIFILARSFSARRQLQLVISFFLSVLHKLIMLDGSKVSVPEAIPEQTILFILSLISFDRFEVANKSNFFCRNFGVLLASV